VKARNEHSEVNAMFRHLHVSTADNKVT